jgi:hypothetical protein
MRSCVDEDRALRHAGDSAPSAPSATARTSSSLPTHIITISWPAAALRGVFAALPLCFCVQASALAKVRL